jgi:hypothetical protein
MGAMRAEFIEVVASFRRQAARACRLQAQLRATVESASF